jgi:hypothetical protein
MCESPSLIAETGQPATQAPQLMHSSLITYAMIKILLEILFLSYYTIFYAEIQQYS